MASPVRSGADGQYASPTREGLTALSLMLTYLFNSTNGKDVCCLQGTPPCWDGCVWWDEGVVTAPARGG
jgi:hypothetical protein